MAVSAVLALTSFFFKKKLNPVINHYYITPQSYNTAFYFYFYFFFLTFIKPQDSSSAVYMVSNIVYFVFVTVTVILFMKYDITVIKHIALIFFSAYIFYKYYDLVWLLLHKSLVLIILGFLFIGAATIAAIRWGVFKKDVQ
jgi:uncharacterized membrane protein